MNESQGQGRIRIVIADDHHLVRQGIRAVLGREPDLEIVGEARDGFEALEMVNCLAPQVLVLDLMMPRLHGLEVIQRLAAQPSTRVVVLSMYGNERSVATSLALGAVEFVAKDADPSELLRAVRAIARARKPISSLQRGRQANPRLADRPKDAYSVLTPREREVLKLVAEGYSSAKIAARFRLSRRTVETHRSNLMQKLSLRDQTSLVKYAIARGIVGVDWYPPDGG